jgi:predicted peptidase
MKIRRGLFIIVLIFSLITDVPGQTELFEKRIYRSGDFEMPYRLHVPENFDTAMRYPIILYFHGSGERGTDNEVTLKHGVQNFVQAEYLEKYPCFILVPQCMPEHRWVEVHWSLPSHTRPEQMSVPMCMAVEILDLTIDFYPIDTTRMYVTGLSMGGFATWDIISRFPDRFAAAVPVCGGGDTTLASFMIHVPVWAFHGELDKVVLPSRSVDMVDAINNNGGNAKLTMFETVAHNAWDKAYTNPKMIDWLFSQQRTMTKNEE